MDLTQICAIRDEAKLIKNSEKTSDATLSGFENIKTNSLSSSPPCGISSSRRPLVDTKFSDSVINRRIKRPSAMRTTEGIMTKISRNETMEVKFNQTMILLDSKCLPRECLQCRLLAQAWTGDRREF